MVCGHIVDKLLRHSGAVPTCDQETKCLKLVSETFIEGIWTSLTFAARFGGNAAGQVIVETWDMSQKPITDFSAERPGTLDGPGVKAQRSRPRARNTKPVQAPARHNCPPNLASKSLLFCLRCHMTDRR